MDNIRENIKNIRILLNDTDLNRCRDDISEGLDRVEAIIDHLETKNHKVRKKLEATLREINYDLNSDLEEIGDILY